MAKTRKDKIWTDEYVVEVLDKMIEELNNAQSELNINKSIQPKYLTWLELCQGVGVPYSVLMQKMKEFIKESEHSQAINLKRNVIDKQLTAVMTSGALRKEVDGGTFKHISINQGNVSERTDNTSVNYNFEHDITHKFDSNQLSEMLTAFYDELKELTSYMDYHKTTKKVGNQGGKRK